MRGVVGGITGEIWQAIVSTAVGPGSVDAACYRLAMSLGITLVLVQFVEGVALSLTF